MIFAKRRRVRRYEKTAFERVLFVRSRALSGGEVAAASINGPARA
jgi:hypothetical protein